ncbi:MAG: polymer-forming cytoskeletal protein [Nannocystis sp.]|nr:polymer-forming cytoskeletal protein [Nannocystis sp.]MBA3547510.1 polymer-forming cytoskeletal protein [Nannocystis sp.]
MATTVIGSSIVIDGEISGEEHLVVHGTVKGRINVRDSLVVENGGLVEATVETSSITVNGTVNGDISASERAELRPNSTVIGDIRAPRILIADGASFKGNVDMGG